MRSCWKQCSRDICFILDRDLWLCTDFFFFFYHTSTKTYLVCGFWHFVAMWVCEGGNTDKWDTTMRVGRLNLGPQEGLQGNRGFLNKCRATLHCAHELFENCTTGCVLSLMLSKGYRNNINCWRKNAEFGFQRSNLVCQLLCLIVPITHRIKAVVVNAE